MFIVRDCSETKLTVVFGICMLLSPGSPIFRTLAQGVHENMQSYMGNSKNEILGDDDYDMNRWISLA